MNIQSAYESLREAQYGPLVTNFTPDDIHSLAGLVGDNADIAVTLDGDRITKARIRQPAHRKTLAPEKTT